MYDLIKYNEPDLFQLLSILKIGEENQQWRNPKGVEGR